MHKVLTSIALLAAAASLSAPATAAGVESPDDCRQYRQVADDVYVQEFDAVDVTGGIAGIPDRISTDLAPGEQGAVCVGFHNRTGGDITLAFRPHDIGVGRAGAPLPVASGEEVFGAGQWLDVPDGPATIGHGELVWLYVEADIPEDASGGSAYAGVSGTVVPEDLVRPDVPVATQVSPAVVVQIFFDVPGDITTGGRIEDARAPDIVWWDGLDIADIGFLERLRGQGIAPVRFDWRNTGSLTDSIDAQVRIESSLGGRVVARLEIPEQVVLRDSEREFEATWSRDIPFVGRFTPTIVATDASGTVHRQKLDPIWVIPSWWYLLALVLALAIPIWSRIRSGRRYRALLERLEAAEHHGAGHHDGDEYEHDEDHRW